VLSSPGSALVRLPDEVKDHLKPDTLFLLNKSDIITKLPPKPSFKLQEYGINVDGNKCPHAWVVSLRTSEGTQLFLNDLAEILRMRYFTHIYRLNGHPNFFVRYANGIDRTSPLITHTRHRDFLEQAVMHLEEFIAFCKHPAFSLVHYT